MDLLLRGKYVLTSAAQRDARRADGRRGPRPWRQRRRGRGLARRSDEAIRRRGSSATASSCCMPGLVDAHSHGRAISPDPEGRAQRLSREQPPRLGDHADLRPRADGGARRRPSRAQRVHHDPPHGLRYGGPPGASTSASARSAPTSTAASASPSRRACATSTSSCSTPTPSSAPCRRTCAPSRSRSSTSTARPWSATTSSSSTSSTARSTPKTPASC